VAHDRGGQGVGQGAGGAHRDLVGDVIQAAHVLVQAGRCHPEVCRQAAEREGLGALFIGADERVLAVEGDGVVVQADVP